MEPVRLIEHPASGYWCTELNAGTAEYVEWETETAKDLEALGIKQDTLQPIVDRIEGDPCILDAKTKPSDRYSLLFGLFETGQVDCERFERVVILPTGLKVTL